MSNNASSNKTPRHVAIIMDGNGRWAKKRLLPRTMGHRAAVKIVRNVVSAAVDFDIDYLTLFAFGRENWNRPQSEVNTLMKLFEEVLYSEIDELHQQGVQYQVVGDRHRLSDNLISAIEYAENLTCQNQTLKLRIAIDYSGQWDIVNACKQVIQAVQSGKITDIDAINESDIANELVTGEDPFVDLLIRTSGERRISNFMLWQLSYAELYFTERLWPDFTRADLKKAIDFFSNCERRFGKTSEQLMENK